MVGEMYGNRTRDSGITTRGFATKLTSPLKIFLLTNTETSFRYARLRSRYILFRLGYSSERSVVQFNEGNTFRIVSIR